MAQQCKRCSVCEGLDHHWLEGFAEDEDGEIIYPDEPIWKCAHCPATKSYEDCDGQYEDDEEEDPASVMDVPDGFLY